MRGQTIRDKVLWRLLLFDVALLVIVGLWASGCPKGAYHDAVLIEHDFKETVKAFQQGETDEFNAGRVSAAEHRDLEGYVEKVGLAGQALTDALQKGATQTSISGDLNVLAAAVGDLADKGVLGIKNETSKAALKAAIAGVQALLKNLQTMLAQPATTTLPKVSGAFTGCVECVLIGGE
jgi:hypothetical protein